jgi:Ca-activated chloride channel homolog
VQIGGNNALTRSEFAAGLSDLLDHLTQLIAANANAVSKADLTTLKKLQEDFAAELIVLRDRVDGWPALTNAEFGALQLSPTPKLSGSASTPPRASSGAALVKPMLSASPPIMPARRARVTDSLGRVSNQPTAPGSFPDQDRRHRPGPGNTEAYNPITDNPFFRPSSDPLSTFSIDVDTASYSNVRRFINQGQLPPKDAVRIEELINYFPYDYPQPTGDQPFSVTTEVAAAPWNAKHKLVQIGLKGKQLPTLQPSNLVFLIDVSGSMNAPNKLPLVKQSLCLLVQELQDRDRVTLVVYAGNAGLVLPPTPGQQKNKIMAAIDKLEAGGSTAGGEGIQLAYKMAQQNFLKAGNNRVILATDGDFNVGASSDAELVRMIEQRRDQGIFLTVLGFGTGNYKDSKMEQLADQGNGNYAYIDTLAESRKVLVKDLRGTLFTIAKDVKIQVEFNPAKVQAYRLIGYENRILQNQDFNDDKKDAGEIGSGHTITALYEIIPTGVASDIKLPTVDSLKYQKPNANANASSSNELLQVKLRYQAPTGSTSQLITQVVADRPTGTLSANLKFSSAVAMYGMLLRDSEFKGQASFNQVLQLASQADGTDQDGYRAEFIRLVQRSQALSKGDR